MLCFVWLLGVSTTLKKVRERDRPACIHFSVITQGATSEEDEQTEIQQFKKEQIQQKIKQKAKFNREAITLQAEAGLIESNINDANTIRRSTRIGKNKQQEQTFGDTGTEKKGKEKILKKKNDDDSENDDEEADSELEEKEMSQDEGEESPPVIELPPAKRVRQDLRKPKPTVDRKPPAVRKTAAGKSVRKKKRNDIQSSASEDEGKTVRKRSNKKKDAVSKDIFNGDPRELYDSTRALNIPDAFVDELWQETK